MPKTILDTIIAWKCQEIVRRKQTWPAEVIQEQAAQAPPPRGFAGALRRPGVSLIAEIKRASPSKGSIRPDLDPMALARIYDANGAAAISVLTDEHFFKGSLDDLRVVHSGMSLPVLRKDFILEPYQVYEARAAGADALLLIVAALDDDDLAVLYQLTRKLGMEALVEVHNKAELQRALQIKPQVIGVNNRDLRTFTVDLKTTATLRADVPSGVILVSESGIHTSADVVRLTEIGVDAMLVGESLVKAQDVGRQVRELVGHNTSRVQRHT